MKKKRNVRKMITNFAGEDEWQHCANCLDLVNMISVQYILFQKLSHLSECKVAMVREKYLENEIFSRSGKSQEIL